MKGSRRKFALLLILIIIAVLATIPVHMSHQRDRLARALSDELGRQVAFRDVQLRLLPQPGFDIRGPFTIADDPAFSKEPLLRADSVRADLRLASLWRGRIEIAKIALDNPSINLVRNDADHWNLEPLLLRASQIPSAPTPQPHVEARPRFPYIEASNARINFKFGIYKSVYALTEADLSFWLETDDRWNARLEAKPLRTDIPIADTGRIKFRGRLGRAPRLGDIAFDGVAELNDAQLGQVSKLLVGHDAGWRGALNGELTARGTLAHLTVASKVRVNQFRRYDVATDDALALAADCSALLNYTVGADNVPVRSLNALSCTSPLESGRLVVSGDLTHSHGQTDYGLRVIADHMPAAALAAIYRNVQRNVPSDFHARGELNCDFSFSANDVSGEGSVANLTISSSDLHTPLAFPESVRLATGPERASIELFPTPLGAVGGLLSGSFDTRSYTFHLETSAPVANLLEAAQTLGIRVPFRAKSGHASGSIQLTGNWTGYQHTLATGDLELEDVQAFEDERRFILRSAHLHMDKDAATLANIRGELPTANLSVVGTATATRPCDLLQDCQVTADLRVDRLDVPSLQKVLDSDRGFLGSILPRNTWFERHRDTLERLNVAGTLRIGRISWPASAFTNASTAFRLRDGKLALANTALEFAGGQLRSPASTIDFDTGVPRYHVALSATGLPLSVLLHSEGPVLGTLNSEMELSTAGYVASDLAQNAEGIARFELLNGSIPDNTQTFPFRRMAGTAKIQNRQIMIEDGTTLTGVSGKTWQTSGQVDFSDRLDLHLVRSSEHLDINGHLAPASNKK